MDIIFIGDKNGTIRELSSLIKTSNQWMDYMENILHIGSINGRHDNSQVSVFNHQDCPYRLCDMDVPQCNTGFVYMIVSMKVKNSVTLGKM